MLEQLEKDPDDRNNIMAAISVAVPIRTKPS